MSRPLAFALLFAVSASLAAGPPTPVPATGACGGSYVVARGDTLYSIARRCHSSVEAVARASGLADPRRIEIGQRLVIAEPGGPLPSETAKPEPRGSEAVLSYRFVPGDTLYSLARWARVGVGALIAANPGINPHKVEIGDSVRLPAGAVAPDAARMRERGTGPGPALVRPDEVMQPRAEANRRAPVRVHEDHARPAPPAPHGDKPEVEDERAPEGM